jgi:hypothetical protein
VVLAVLVVPLSRANAGLPVIFLQLQFALKTVLLLAVLDLAAVAAAVTV